MWAIIAKGLGSLLGALIPEWFKGRAQRRQGAQEASSRRLEKTHEQAQERIKIEAEGDKMDRAELLDDPDLVRHTRPDDK